MITRATLRAMRRRAQEADRAQRFGWPVNSKDKLLRQLSEDIERLADEVERLREAS
jgi:hypothetical protein